MIRPIDIRLNAAHPELPLAEATTYTGAPSTVLIRGVPANCGKWAITAVSVAATYPDNTTTTRAAVQSANGVWVATIPATATSGRTACGLRVLADGVDENGNAVTGFVLGFADFSVLSFTPVPAPGGTFWLLRYFDAPPTTPKKGDAAIVGGILKYYNGATWLPFADLTNYYTKTETDNAIERVAAYYITENAQGDNFATRAALLNATTYYSGGVVRVPTRNDYAVVLADETHDGAEYRYIYAVPDGSTTGQWEAQYPIETNDYSQLSNKPSINGHALTGESSQSGASLGLLDLAGGAMQGVITDISAAGDSNRRLNLAKISLVPVGVSRKGQGKLGVCLELQDGTGRGCSLYIDDDGKVYINTPTGYVEVPNATSGGVLALVSQIPDVSTKANASDLPYALVTPSDFGYREGEPCTDHAINSGVCPAVSAFVSVPASVAGKSRDFFIRFDASSRSSDVPVTVEGATLVGPDGTAIATLIVKSHSVTTWRLTEVKNGTTSPFADPVFMVTGANQAPLASPAFTGTPTAPTPSSGDDSTKVATTAFVQGEIAGKVDNAAIAPEFSTASTYAVDDVVMHEGLRYKCTTAVTVAGDWTGSTNWTAETVQSRIDEKADASDLRYSFNTATVSSGTTPTVTDLADRAINTATLGSTVTAATVTLPAATANRARDFFIDLTIEATTAPTLTFIDPATNTTANVTFGADSLADIDTGKNAVLFSEFPNYTWIVSVKHEGVSA